MVLNKPVVGMAATPDGRGYWLVASDGGIFSYGDAQFYGSTGSIVLNKPIVGMAATPDGGGYWLVASDGGIFSYGDARVLRQHGEHAAQQARRRHGRHHRAATATGWWPPTAGSSAYGDASFHGSTGSLVLNRPIVGMITGPGGAGYFLVASDGGIFSFGTAPVLRLARRPAAEEPDRGGAAATSNGMPSGQRGYWFTDTAGLVSNFGGAKLLRVRTRPPLPTHRRHGRGTRQRILRGRDLPLGRPTASTSASTSAAASRPATTRSASSRWTGAPRATPTRAWPRRRHGPVAG